MPNYLKIKIKQKFLINIYYGKLVFLKKNHNLEKYFKVLAKRG